MSTRRVTMRIEDKVDGHHFVLDKVISEHMLESASYKDVLLLHVYLAMKEEFDHHIQASSSNTKEMEGT